jgi:hypothetical protein
LIAHKETKCLSLPTHLWLKEGNVHDLVALREIADELPFVISLAQIKHTLMKNLNQNCKVNKSNYLRQSRNQRKQN